MKNLGRATTVLLGTTLIACVGDSPTVTPPVDGGPDVTATLDGGGGDANPDAVVDAGPPPCGAPGESCCVAPLAACGDGLTCSTGTKKCLVSDAWALGEYHTVTPGPTFVTAIVTAHYDGATWTLGKEVVVDTAITSYHAGDIYESPGGDVRAFANKANIGKMYTWNGVVWQECKLGNSCVGPSNAELQALTSVTNSGNVEYWLAGTNAMFRCTPASCVSVTTGIPGTWGQGAFAGTVAQDIWYSQFDHVLHFDGTKWSSTTVADAYTIGQVGTNDLWIGTKQLRHWDGTAWSNAFVIDGAPAPGTIYSIGGSGSKDVWAVGSDGSSAGFTAHWDGTSWTKKALPNGTANVQRVWAPSPLDAFVVGGKPTEDQTAIIDHWDGTAWTEMPSPKFTYPNEIQAGALRWYSISGRARPRP